MKNNKKCPKCLPSWLGTFGDLMSLLLVFFILLLSMSVLNEQKIVEYLAHMRQSLGVMKNNKMSDNSILKPSELTTPMKDTADDYQQSLNKITESIIQLNKRNKYNEEIDNEEMDTDYFASLDIGKKSFVITLPAKILFKEGEYNIHNKNIDIFIMNIYNILNKYIKNNKFNDIEVEVSGYSSSQDSIYLNTLIHPKNLLELAFFRAESISNLIIKNGFPKNKIKTTSYGNSKIIDYDNDNKNRRVEIKITSSKFISNLYKNKKSFFKKKEQK